MTVLNWKCKAILVGKFLTHNCMFATNSILDHILSPCVYISYSDIQCVYLAISYNRKPAWKGLVMLNTFIVFNYYTLWLCIWFLCMNPCHALQLSYICLCMMLENKFSSMLYNICTAFIYCYTSLLVFLPNTLPMLYHAAAYYTWLLLLPIDLNDDNILVHLINSRFVLKAQLICSSSVVLSSLLTVPYSL